MPLRSEGLEEKQGQNHTRGALLREPVKVGTSPRHLLDTGFVLPLCVTAKEPGAGSASGGPIISHLSYRRDMIHPSQSVKRNLK